MSRAEPPTSALGAHQCAALADARQPGQDAAQSTVRRQAWARAMESRQMADWFHPFDSHGAAIHHSARGPTPPPAGLASPGTPWRLPLAGPPTESSQGRPDDGAADASAPQAPVAQTAATFDAPRGLDHGSQPRDGAVQRVATPGADGPSVPVSPSADAAPRSPLFHEEAAGRAPPRPAAGLPSVAVQEAAARFAAATTGSGHADGPTPAPRGLVTAGLLLPPVPLSTTVQQSPLTVPAVPAFTPATHRAGPAPRAVPAPAVQKLVEQLLTRTGAAPPVRIHVQPHAEGLQVWLGMDGTPQRIQEQLELLLPELDRALAARGSRLLRVICNGQPVWTAPSPANPANPATPSPSHRRDTA